MDNLSPDIISVLVGLIVPAIVSYLKNPNWSRQLKQGIAIAVSVVVTLASLLVTGELVFDGNFLANLGASLSVVIATSTVFYNLWFKNTVTNNKLEAAGPYQDATISPAQDNTIAPPEGSDTIGPGGTDDV